MKQMKHIKRIKLGLLVTLLFVACESFLEEKSDGTLVIPSTLADLQALMDNVTPRNGNFSSAGEVSADDYFLPEEVYSSLPEEIRRMYTWEPDFIFSLIGNNDWFLCYQAIYTFSSVLKSLEDIPRVASNTTEWDNVKGQALALRAFRYLDAVLIWGPAYDEVTADTDLGIPLRNTPDFNVPSVRSTIRETYIQVIDDLKQSVSLLPVTDINAARPTKAMAYGLLARTYLNMQDYEAAGRYADSCLRLHDTLIDYNSLDSNAAFTFPRPLNDEVIFLGVLSSNATVAQARITNECYDSYHEDDLRKSVYFSRVGDTYQFKGQYTGYQSLFGGVAIDEVFLILSECLIRRGMVEEGLDNLNILLETRWKAGTFQPISTSIQEEALKIVLMERRKQLMRRGLRWHDLKRLNKEGANIVLERNLDNTVFTLPANDLRYALPIPEDVIELSGMPQNPR